MGLVVQETDAIATVPYYLSQVLLVRENLQILPAPLDFPTYDVKQHWHMSCHHKSSHKWFRQTCYELLKSKEDVRKILTSSAWFDFRLQLQQL